MDLIYYKDIQNGSLSLEIKDRFEVCQGGPQPGSLCMNGKSFFEGRRFCGPMIQSGNNVFMSEYIKGFWGARFQLAVFDLESEEMNLLPQKGDYLAPLSVAGSTLNYAADIEGRQQYKVDFSLE